MITEANILALQFSASIFMATDYFFNDQQRKAINDAIHRVIKPLQDNIDSDIRDRRDYVIQQWVGILVSIAFILISFVGTKLLAYMPDLIAPLAIALLAIFFMFFLAGGMPKVLDLVVKVAVPVAIAGFLRLVTSFLLKCPKGTIFGVGFLFLLASFACRYARLP